jgi:hypothetical protein
MDRRPQPSDFAFEAFARTAAHACVFELKLRLLADNTPNLARWSLEQKLSKVLEVVLGEYGPKLSDDDKKLLGECARLRNKLIHVELSRVTGRLVTFGEELNRGQVVQLTLDTGEIKQVAQTATQDGKIIGWLLESALSRAFDAGQRIFFNGILVLDGLFPGADLDPNA